MSGVRGTTAVGIAFGGAVGALAALLGAPQPPAPPPPSVTVPEGSGIAAEGRAPAAAESITATGSSAARVEQPASAPSEVGAGSDMTAPPIPSSTTATERAARPRSAPPLAPLATHDALMKAMLFCDQRKDFDECARAAEALEKGSAGPADAEQAKRFRRIALTHLVQQCEAGAPHACFVLAAKYRGGSDVAQNAVSADALEKRGLDLCRHRTAPECPAPP